MSHERTTVPAFFELARARHPNQTVQIDRKGEVTYDAMLGRAAAVAEGLRKMDVQPGDRIGLMADNSRDWIVADLAIQIARAVSVPRGTDTPTEEMAFLFRHADVGVALVHDAATAKRVEEMRATVPTITEIVCIDPKGAPGRTLDDLAEAGAGGPSFGEQAAKVRADDIATIIYTSGTTGRPKGVVLTHGNFGHQVEVIPPMFEMDDDEVFLSILPPWHSFERTVEYAALATGGRIAYTDRRRFKEDLVGFRPTFVPSVPRLWETIYDGVRKALTKGGPLRRGLFGAGYAVAKARAWCWDRARGHVLQLRKPRGPGRLVEGGKRALAFLGAAATFPIDRLAHVVVFRRVRDATGGRLRGAISGGGLMPPHIDRFFRTIGVPILVGYGLTETSPVVTCRREHRNVLGTIGRVIPEVEVQIRDLESGEPLPAPQPGLVWTRGPHVMQGYYKDDEITRSVVDDDGWFNTGDLGFLTEWGDLCFHGRAKETIVLAGGENVEPSHVEAAILESPFVSQAVVVGQDRKTLAALLVPEPEPLLRELGRSGPGDHAALASDAEVIELLRAETRRRTSGLMPFERIARVALLPGPLDVENGCLTQTMKLKRHVVVKRFEDLIEKAYDR